MQCRRIRIVYKEKDKSRYILVMRMPDNTNLEVEVSELAFNRALVEKSKKVEG